MKLGYWKCPSGNFGDDLNNWLWPRLLPHAFEDDSEDLFVAIGTLLTAEFLSEEHRRKIIFGAGAWKGKATPVIDNSFDFHFVRGPLTARLLNLDWSLAVTDPAILVRIMNLPSLPHKHRFAYMPHHWSVELGLWKDVCDAEGIHYIDPTQDVVATLNDIRSTQVFLTEAMHGAIIADALRIPWIPVWAYQHILEFKWQDWGQSVDLEIEPTRVPSLWRPSKSASRSKRLLGILKSRYVGKQLLKATQAGRPHLSSDESHERAYCRVVEKLEGLRNTLYPAAGA